MRDARGIASGEPADRRREKPSGTGGRMHPAEYVDRYFRETARRINFIRRHAGRHFEAAKFCLELEALLSHEAGTPPRRA